MKNLLAICLISFLLASCQNPTNSNSESPETTTMNTRAPFVHTVFFYLNDDVTEEQKAAFENGMHKLGTAPTIANYRIGKPAMTPREIVDNSYGYAWIVEFANSADQDAYQTEPIHLEFIELYQGLWKDVKVFDSLMLN